MRLKDIPENAPDDQPLDDEQKVAALKFADLLTRVAWTARAATTVGQIRAIGRELDAAEKDFD